MTERVRAWTFDQATRRHQPWTAAEDQKLLKRLHELDGAPDRYETLAREHSRTKGSITTRVSALKAGIRLASQRSS